MSSFTCITCHVAFSTFDIQREHYKTDWHRYNLKRKVAEMAPVTLEDFHARFLAPTNAPQGADDEQGKTIVCHQCKKHFTNQNSYDNHLKSKKHQEIVKRAVHTEGSAAEQKNAQNVDVTKSTTPALQGCAPRANRVSSTEDMESDGSEWEDADDDDAVSAECCLFCSREGLSLEDNVNHMTIAHSFFIPDVEYLTDLDGLVLYLSAKVNSENMCLWCNERGKSFGSAQAVQQHMLSKGHFKMLFEGDALAEYADYYDYSSSYPEHEAGSEDAEEEVHVDVLDGDDLKLVLPSGAVVGHRLLMKYYRQNVPPRRQKPAKSQHVVQNLLSQYRGIGHSSTSSEMVIRRARDMKYLQNVKAKMEMQRGMKNNKLQKYMRLQYKI